MRVQSPPYLSIRKTPGLEGNDRYEGYSVDLAEKICRHYLNVDYEIKLVADEKYGEQENGTWNGMVGVLARRVCIRGRHFTPLTCRVKAKFHYAIQLASRSQTS